jgi:uncharacterized membrane protein YhaH (DUF805 family)
MSFPEAVRSVLSQYVGFSGRARRSEYWWYILFYLIVAIVASIIDNILGTDSGNTGLVAGLVALALFLPTLAVSVRRLHDTGRSGWWILLGLIPLIGAIILIVWYCQDSQGPNAYGPSPKESPAGGYASPSTDAGYGTPPAG